MKHAQKTVLYITSLLLIGCLGWIFVHAVCTVPQAKNIFKSRNMLPVILTGSIFVMLLFLKLAEASRSWKKRTLLTGTAVVFVMILILQLLYLYYVRYWVGYDNLLVLDEAWHMQSGERISPEFYDFYFQRYPHNHPVTILLYWVLRSAAKLGIADLYWIPHLVGLVSIDTALLFMWKLSCETADVHRGFLLAVLGLLNPVIYIWMAWHYTTICVLPFLSAGIYFCWKVWKTEKIQKKIFCAVLAGIFAAIGMRIRITEGILLIAVLIVGICMKIWKKRWFIGCLTALVLTFAVVWMLTGAAGKYYADFDSSEKEFPPVHFVMMGLEGDGTYKKTDVEFTEKFQGEEAKTKADMNKAESRIRNQGLHGLLSLMGRKMLITWQDGSGGLQSEWLYPLKDSRLFQYICGEKNDPFLCWAQIFYVMLLFLVIVGTGAELLSGKMGTGTVLRLILLGNILFYLMWEAQNHYGLGMMGILLFLAADGCDILCESKKRVVARNFLGSILRKRSIWGMTVGGLFVMLTVQMYHPLFSETVQWREFSVRNIYRVGQNLQDLVSGDRITQTFTTSSCFNHILVQGYLKNGEKADGGCQLQIQDETGKIIADTFLTAQQIVENQLDFIFDPIVPEGESMYTIVIEPRKIGKNNALQLYRFNSSIDLYPEGKLSCNGKEENGDLIFSVYEEKTGTIFRRFWE